MTDTPPPLAPAPLAPYVTGAELAARIGGGVSAELAEPFAYAATGAVFQLVADPGWDAAADPSNPPPEGVRQVALMVGTELYRAGVSAAPGGEYALDPYDTVPASVSSATVRRYSAFLAPWARTSGMIG